MIYNQKSPGHVYLSTIKISYNALKSTLPKELDDRLQKLDITYICNNPKASIQELEELIKKFPNVPILYNNLAAAYSIKGDNKKAAQIGIENYRKNPDYLTGRCNYALLCFSDGNIDEIPKIFPHFDLASLYPHRNEFHITEAISFHAIAGLYYCHTKNFKSSHLMLKFLKEVAPVHQLTKELDRNLRLNDLEYKAHSKAL